MKLPCHVDLDRWAGATRDNPEARKVCRGCWNRLGCARDALHAEAQRAHPVGIWAGVFLPSAVGGDDYRNHRRRRNAALGQLSSIVQQLQERNDHATDPLAG